MAAGCSEARDSRGPSLQVIAMAGCAGTEPGHVTGRLLGGDSVLCPLGPIRVRVGVAAAVAVMAGRLVAEVDVDLVAGNTDRFLR